MTTRATMGQAGRVWDAPLPRMEMDCRTLVVFLFAPSGCSSSRKEGRGTGGQGWAGLGWAAFGAGIGIVVRCLDGLVVVARSAQNMPGRENQWRVW
jgi:hypothetical protein